MLPGFRPAIEAYYAAMDGVAHRSADIQTCRNHLCWAQKGWRKRLRASVCLGGGLLFNPPLNCARRLLRLIALGLGLDPAFFDSSFDAATSNVRVIHYLPGEHSARDGIFGVGGPFQLHRVSCRFSPLFPSEVLVR